jgi:hypothetical protein
MMAAAITRALKLDTVRRTADGGVSVTDTRAPPYKVAHSCKMQRKEVLELVGCSALLAVYKQRGMIFLEADIRRPDFGVVTSSVLDF